MSCPNFKKIVLKSRYSYNFKTIFLTVNCYFQSHVHVCRSLHHRYDLRISGGIKWNKYFHWKQIHRKYSTFFIDRLIIDYLMTVINLAQHSNIWVYGSLVHEIFSKLHGNSVSWEKILIGKVQTTKKYHQCLTFFDFSGQYFA